MAMLLSRALRVGPLARAPVRASSRLAALNNNRFDDATLKASVDDATWAAWSKSVQDGTMVPKEHAKAVASAIHKWASDRGCVQFSHVFYPFRNMKAGVKHDSFVSLNFGDEHPLKEITTGFSSGQLFMSETDGSSFPNGGLRATHTAAAYMNWDRSSPPYIKGDTLYFPSAFTSFNGDALDYKTPLLRSQRAVSDAATKLLHQMGHTDVSKVHANVGAEQEFFVIPRELFVSRPDLVNGRRTVFGADPPLNQQLSDQYFTMMQPRVKAYMEDVQDAMWESGISFVVKHNEVAPSQHELSPIFALTNVAADQNILTVELMQEIAAEHDLAVLFEEKPFANINGSGKHANWGLNTDTGLNLYNPSDAPEEFIAFTAAVLHGIHKYADVIRTGVASYGNDFRLGGHEAPPAIFSLYAGQVLGAHLEAVAGGGELAGYDGGRYGVRTIDMGAPELAPLGAALEDRNRTAPIPFCGNRFELRAVGSNANVAFSMTMLNTIVAEGLSQISAKVDAGTSVRDAVGEILKDSMPAMFNGDGYDTAWHHEAEFDRGLLNLPTTVDALKHFNSEKNHELFEKHQVFSKGEVEAVTSIMYERYYLDCEIEAKTMLNMLNQGILPACAADLTAYDGTGLAGSRAEVYSEVAAETAALAAVVDAWPQDDEATAAQYAKDTVKPAMDAARAAQDAAELLIDSDKYPYPTYFDMLFPHHSDGRV